MSPFLMRRIFGRNTRQYSKSIRPSPIQSSTMRLALGSLAGTGLVLSIPLVGWPFLDIYIWPKAIEKSMCLEKKLPYPEEVVSESDCRWIKRAFNNNRNGGKIILLRGSRASAVARKFASDTTPCSYMDFRSLFDMNAYDSLCFQYLGWYGSVLNVFMKLVVFASSVGNGTMGRPESFYPFSRNCFNNLRRTLREMRDQKNYSDRRFLVFDNFGTSVSWTALCTGKIREHSEYAHLTYVEMIASLASEDLCDVIIVWRDHEEVMMSGEKLPWQSGVAAYVDGISAEVVDLTEKRSGWW